MIGMTHGFHTKYSSTLKVFKEKSNRKNGEYKREHTAELINDM